MQVLDDGIEDRQIPAVVLDRERKRTKESVRDDLRRNLLRNGASAARTLADRVLCRKGVLRPDLFEISHHFTSFSATVTFIATVHQPRPVVMSAPICNRLFFTASFASSVARSFASRALNTA